MSDRSIEELRYGFEELANELTSRFTTEQQRIRARFPEGYVRGVDELVASRWPYLARESRLRLASMIQLSDVNRWNLNVWDMGPAVRSTWEWYCSIPLVSMMEALVVQYAKKGGSLETKNQFHDSINFLWDKRVIDETLKAQLHGWRKFRNLIHLDPRSRIEPNCSYDDAVLSLKSLEATLLLDWKQVVKPIVEFGNIFLTYDEYFGHETGMAIHCAFTIYNALHEKCRAVAFFYFESGEQLRDFNNEFKTTEGYSAAWEDFVPPWNDAAFTGDAAVRIFMPYSELHLGSGEHQLKFYIGLYSYDMNSYFAFSPWYHFDLQCP